MEGTDKDDDEESRLAGVSDQLIHRITASGSDEPGGHRDPVLWPTVDGPLGLCEERSMEYARSFFRWGFFFLPFLWAVNCFYFWPVLRYRSTCFQRIRPYVVGSAIGFSMFMSVLLSWALTFAIGGERLFGPVWKDLVVYNVADKFGLTGWV